MTLGDSMCQLGSSLVSDVDIGGGYECVKTFICLYIWEISIPSSQFYKNCSKK